MRCCRYALLLCLLCLPGSCSRSFEHNRSGMQQVNKVLEDKFGAGAWYSSVTLVHDGAGDDMISVERATDTAQTHQEQWTWFHGFWEKKADIKLHYSGIRPGALLFRLQNGAYLLQLGQLVENGLKQLAANPANGKCKLVMAGIKMNDPGPAQHANLVYIIQLKTAIGVTYSYTYNQLGQLLPAAVQP